MKNQERHVVAVWIDHRKAVIVTFVDDHSLTHTIQSKMESHTRFHSGSREKNVPYGAQHGDTERQRDARFEGHLHRYYQIVLGSIKGATELLILGPGESKKELEKNVRHEGEFRNTQITVQPADKMTQAQLIAAARRQFKIA